MAVNTDKKQAWATEVIHTPAPDAVRRLRRLAELLLAKK